MKLSKHKLSTQDLELMITNLKAFIVKVEEDKENQEYSMQNGDYCVYAKTMKEQWSSNKVSELLLGKKCFNNGDIAEHVGSKLFDKARNLFCGYYFNSNVYDNTAVTKQQWLEVANKVVLKLEKKLHKRKVKVIQKSMDTDLVM